MKKGNQILDYLKEITIVVIGVLIAVSISNYKEKLENETYLKNTLKAIESEVISSQTDIDTVLAGHIELYYKLESEFGENEQTLGAFLSNSGGFQAATIKNISLRFFIANKAELLKFEIISQLLDIESATEILASKLERLANYAYDHINDNSEEVRIKFTFLLSDVIESEQTLSESYSNFLKENSLYLKEKSK
jgi:hypothetical protein